MILRARPATSWRAALLALLTTVLLASAPSGPAAGQEDAAERGPYRSYVPLATRDALPPPLVIGHSVEGRPIGAWSTGQGETTIALLGGLHTGPEQETVTIVRALLDFYFNNPDAVPENVTLVFVPLINPDGAAYGSRLNANGVDLNRNFPTDDWQPEAAGPGGLENGGTAPLSEPETRALYDFLLDIEPDLVIEWHGYAGLVEANEIPAGAVMGHHYAHEAKYDYLEEWVAYPITGELAVEMEELGIGAFDVELALDDPLAMPRNIAATRAVVDALAGGTFAMATGEEGACVPIYRDAASIPEDGAEPDTGPSCVAPDTLLWATGIPGPSPAWAHIIVAAEGWDGWIRTSATAPAEPPDWLPQEGTDGAQIGNDPSRRGGR